MIRRQVGERSRGDRGRGTRGTQRMIRGDMKGRTGKEGAYMEKKPAKKSATQIGAMCVCFSASQA